MSKVKELQEEILRLKLTVARLEGEIVGLKGSQGGSWPYWTSPATYPMTPTFIGGSVPTTTTDGNWF